MSSRRCFALVVSCALLASCARGPSLTPTARAPTPGQGSPGSSPAASATAAPASPVPGAPDLRTVRLELAPVATDLDQPLFVTALRDGSGRLYVVLQTGSIAVLDRDRNGQAEPFLDISNRLSAGGERGLLGLAFHPAFGANGRLFVNYTDRNGDTIIAEFRGSATRADPGSERVLLKIDQPFANHNGGWIGFGPDGFLYIATGDGGSGGDPMGNGQRRDTLLGKLLRIDVDRGDPYAIPSGNPFAGQQGSRAEIWAYGLRNPWRASFDRATGDLFIGDVGQNRLEEIDVQPANKGGLNYGWNTMEGNSCFRQDPCDRAGLTLPVLDYGRDQGSTVTGGYVYRGAEFPRLVGAYVFADFGSGAVWGIPAADALRGPVQPVKLLDSDANISSFGEDEAGELYATALGGALYRVVVRD